MNNLTTFESFMNMPKEEDYANLTAAILKPFARVKGGDLKLVRVKDQLRKVLAQFTEIAQQYATKTSSVPAGGFSGANSSTMSMTRSGIPVTISYNNVHRGGFYEGMTMYNIQIQIGGGLELVPHVALLRAAENLLSRFQYTTPYGTTYIKKTDGTNWSSVMMCAPTQDGRFYPLPL